MSTKEWLKEFYGSRRPAYNKFMYELRLCDAQEKASWATLRKAGTPAELEDFVYSISKGNQRVETAKTTMTEKVTVKEEAEVAVVVVVVVEVVVVVVVVCALVAIVAVVIGEVVRGRQQVACSSIATGE